MALYQIHFLSHGHRIFSGELFVAETDESAIAHADAIYRTGIGRGFEIWRGDHHVHTEIYDGRSYEPPTLNEPE